MDDENSEDYKRVRRRIAKWIQYRGKINEPRRYDILRHDLYVVRNPDQNAHEYSTIPSGLIDDREDINASVEHYFLCRAWVGNGVYSAFQVSTFCTIYNAGKWLGISPRHNPNKPVTPPSDMQKYFQQKGIDDGITDARVYGTGASPFSVGLPPMYY